MRRLIVFGVAMMAILVAGQAVAGSFSAIAGGGVEGDEQTSIIYDARTGEIAVDGPASVELTSISIDSIAGVFSYRPDCGPFGADFDNVACGFNFIDAHNISKARFGSSFGSVSFGNAAQAGLTEDFVAGDLTVVGSLVWPGGPLGDVDLIYIPEPSPELHAGDANMDLEFNQLDLVQVQIAAKYLTGQAATWGEGDWNGAPGGRVGDPPAGDGVFDQKDIVAALAPGNYLNGLYAAISEGGVEGDDQTSIIYDARTGEIAVDAPAEKELTSINIDSAAGIFTGDPISCFGSFDSCDLDNNIFKATFGSSFGSLSFGNAAQAGLSEDFVANDLTVVGSLAGGGGLGDVDLIYIPEPSSLLLALLGIVGLLQIRVARFRYCCV